MPLSIPGAIPLSNLQVTGVDASQIGSQYDLALGRVDLSTGICQMVGYIVATGGELRESTDLQDDEHLVQITATNLTDRFTRYPQFSQGSWTGGEAQVFFADPRRYYSSYGLETQYPGDLTGWQRYDYQFVTGATPIGRVVPGRLLSYSDQQDMIWCLSPGQATASSPTLYYYSLSPNGSTATFTATVPTPFPGTFQGPVTWSDSEGGFAIDTMGNLYQFNPAGGNATLVVRGPGNANVPVAPCCLTYYQRRIYFTQPNPATGDSSTAVASTLYQVDAEGPTRTPTAVFTAPNGMGIVDIRQHSQGILMILADSLPDPRSPLVRGSLPQRNQMTYVWLFDGTRGYQIGEIPCQYLSMANSTGTVYICCASALSFALRQQPIIYRVQGSSISVIDDWRDRPTELQVQGMRWASLSADGRFLYLALNSAVLASNSAGVWRYDLATGSLSRIDWSSAVTSGGFPLYGYSDVLAYPGSGGVGVGNVFVQPSAWAAVSVDQNGMHIWFSTNNTTRVPFPDRGQLLTSWYDADTPYSIKRWTALMVNTYTRSQFELNDNPSILVEYQLDSDTAPWTAITPQVLDLAQTQFSFPIDRTSYRIRFRFTLTNGPIYGAWPHIRSYSVQGRLGRRWQVPVACIRNQRLRSGLDDPQGLAAKDLLSNVMTAYRLNAGKMLAFVPSPGSTGIDSSPLAVTLGVNVPPGVELVPVVVEDYEWRSANPGPYPSEYGVPDQEGVLVLTLVEDLVGA